MGALNGELSATAVNAPMVPSEVFYRVLNVSYFDFVLYAGWSSSGYFYSASTSPGISNSCLI